MGLGTKIKEALHSDHQTTTTQPSTADHILPGTFQSDDLLERHNDGKPYTAPHGTAVDDSLKSGTQTGATSGLTSSGTQRNRLSKGTDGRDHSKGAYWGDLSKDGYLGAAGDLPDRTRLGEDTSAATGTTASRDHHLAGQSSGGGIYNSVTGSGSPEHFNTKTSQTAAVHDPLSSGTKGIPLSSGSTSGSNHGLGVTGAATGAGVAAGYGAHEYGQRNKESAGYSGTKASDGVPRSSMLNPEPGLQSSNAPTGGRTGVAGRDDSEGNRGVGTGAHNATGGQPGQFPSGPSNVNTGAGPSADHPSSSPTQSASSGTGRKYFGPGHEGAKVLHSCQHCGRDNDISHYFNKDVVYRLGQ